jgi:hypothetical protein
MPDQPMLQKLEELARQQSDESEKVRFYLEETKRCVEGKAWSAAVVMAWCACICHLNFLASKLSNNFMLFAWFSRSPEKEKFPKRFSSVERVIGKEVPDFTDHDFLDLLKHIEVIPDEFRLFDFLERRNKIAHPDKPQIPQEEAEKFATYLISLMEAMPSEPVINNEAILTEYLTFDIEAKAPPRGSSRWGDKSKQEKDEWLQKTPAEIAQYIHPSKRFETLKKLLEAYISDSGYEHNLFATAFEKIWSFLTPEQQSDMWKIIKQKAKDVLELVGEKRSPYEFAQLIVWPKPEEPNPYRDRIMMKYINWLSNKAEENNFDSIDLEFSLWLHDRLPIPYRPLLLKPLERWFVKRVYKDDFNARDFDLLNFFRLNGTLKNSKYWKIVFDHMSRRYV